MALSTEQELQLELLRRDIQKLSLEEARTYLLELFTHMMVKDNLVKEMIKDIM